MTVQPVSCAAAPSGGGCGGPYGPGAHLTGPLANQALAQAQKSLYASHQQRRRMDTLAHQVREQLESAYREAGKQVAPIPQASQSA